MMKKQFRILIADGGDTFAPLFANALCKAGCWTVIRRQEREALLDAVRCEHPDLTVLNLTQPTLDFYSLTTELRTISAQHILALYRYKMPFTEAILQQDGVCCWRMPDKMPDLISAVLKQFYPDLPEPAQQITEQTLELDVTGLLHAAGVPSKLQGFHFLRSAIIRFCRAPASARLTMQALYPVIAEEYHSTSASVERCIRLAISQAWDQRGSNSHAAFQFPAGQTRRMTNAEFVAYAADWLRLSEQSRAYLSS